MEDQIFTVDFGDELPEFITDVIVDDNNLITDDSGENNEGNEEEIVDINTLTQSDESQNNDDDLETQALFIEGWKETGYLALPDDYDFKGKTATQVMQDHAKNLNDLIKQSFVEKLPEDMREAFSLVLEGKISNAKEYLNYQVSESSGSVEISTDEDARKFLVDYYKKNTGLDDEDIDETIDNLELKDKLITKAKELKGKADQVEKQEKERKKQELLQAEAERKAVLEKVASERANKMKSYISAASWSAEHKRFVEEEISTGMKTTIGTLQEAFKDPEVTPELVSVLSKILKKEGDKITISKDALKSYASSKVGGEIKSLWESKLDKSNLPKQSQRSSTNSSKNDWIFEVAI